MSFKIFIIGVVLFTIICIAVVVFEFLKGRDWRVCGMFMLIGWFIAIGQLASNIKS